MPRHEAAPGVVKSSKELKGKDPFAETPEEEGQIEERRDTPEAEYSREVRGEQALENALERGRELKDTISEKAGPLFAGLRSRIKSAATRALNFLKKSIGFVGEVKDVGLGLGEAVGDMMVKAPKMPGEIARGLVEDVVKPVFYDTPMDILNPVDEAKIEELNNEIDSITLALDTTKGAKERARKEAERARLTTERDALVNAPQSQRPRAQAIRNAPGKVAGAAFNYVDEKAGKGAEYMKEKEQDFLVAGTIAGGALSKILGKEISLSNAQAIALGSSFEAKRIAGRFMTKLGEGVADMVAIEDMAEVAQGNAQAIKGMYMMIADPDNRAWLADELKRINVDVGASIEDVARTIGAASLKGVVKGGRAIGRGAKTVATGAAITGVGAAALATAPVTIPLAAAGLAGYGAYKGVEAGAKAGARAINEKVDEIGPEVRARIDELVAGAQADWATAKPKLLSGLDATVSVVSELALNIENAPRDVKDMIVGGIGELDRLAGEGAALITRAQERVRNALRVAEHARNEIRLALAGEARAAKNPEVLKGVKSAIEARAGVDATDVPEPENLRNVA